MKKLFGLMLLSLLVLSSVAMASDYREYTRKHYVVKTGYVIPELNGHNYFPMTFYINNLSTQSNTATAAVTKSEQGLNKKIADK